MIRLALALACALSSSSPCRLKGRVKVVSAGADYRVRVVASAGDLRVRVVQGPAIMPGEWQFVEAAPDFTVQFVEIAPSFTVQLVHGMPGCVR